MSDDAAFHRTAEKYGVAQQPAGEQRVDRSPEPPVRSQPTNNGQATAASTPALVVRTLSSVERETVRPLFGGRLLFGKLAALAGDGGVGKSYLLHALAAPLTTGAVLPGDTEPAGPCDVIFASYEDEAGDTILPRLADLGADLDRVHTIDGVTEDGRHRSFSAADVATLAAELDQRPRVRMLVIDPVSAWVGGIDEHRQNEVRSALEALRMLAAERGIAVVIVMHLRKASADKALHRLNGSGAYGQLVRSALVAAPDPDSDDGACALAHIKHNLTGKAPTLGYRIDSRGDFYWLGERGDLDGERLTGSDPDDHASALDHAKTWLAEALADGPLPVKRVEALRDAAGVAERTYWRARKALGVPKARLVGRPGEHGSYYVLDPPPDPGGSAGSAGSAGHTLWQTQGDRGEKNPRHEGNLAVSAAPAKGGSAERGGRPGRGADDETIDRLERTRKANLRALGEDGDDVGMTGTSSVPRSEPLIDDSSPDSDGRKPL